MKLKLLILTFLCCFIGFASMAQKNAIKQFESQDLPMQMLQYLNQATSEKEKQKAIEELGYGNIGEGLDFDQEKYPYYHMLFSLT